MKQKILFHLKLFGMLVLVGVLAMQIIRTNSVVTKADTDSVSDFVERMYTVVLDRASDVDGIADWTSKLTRHTGDGATLAHGFIMSKEFKNRNTTDEEYLSILYRTFFNREPDKAGYSDWLSKLSVGVSRELVLAGFVNSGEFARLCVKYGVSQGYMFANGETANPGVGLFVYRLYDTLLSRNPDGNGLYDWTKRISMNQISATEVATKGFILSPEFQKKQETMTDEEYLAVLYATFFDREGDEAGMKYWKEQLAWGAERNEVVYGFANSKEFIQLQKSYDIETKIVKKYTPVTAPEKDKEETEETNDILVAFFSRTGNTKPLAEYAAEYYGADIYEITAEDPYTEADINYGNSQSRTSIEQNDKTARPKIKGSVENMDQYNTIILAYPIWWGQAPRIISTFLESYDFTGKTIIPFCTSHSSGIGNSDKDLHGLVSDKVAWKNGKRFAIGTTKEELIGWLQEVCQKVESDGQEKNMKLYIGETLVPVIWEENDTVKELMDDVTKGDIIVKMSMYSTNEQVGPLGKNYTREDKQTTTRNGDIVLYSGDKIVVFYDSNTWAYTRLGKMNITEDQVTELLSHGDVELKLMAH